MSQKDPNLMEISKYSFKREMFDFHNFRLIDDLDFKVDIFKYKSGVEGIRVTNDVTSFEILPYMGHQIWALEFHGKSFTQKSIFDNPLDTTKFGDNYGGFLLHCGLTNINGPTETEDYPLHGELPFAVYEDNYLEIGKDSNGRFLTISGTYTYRNSQDYYYEFIPKIKLYAKETEVEVTNTINNKRGDTLNYLYMCHMNWLAVDQSELISSVIKDDDSIRLPDVLENTGSEREHRLNEFVKEIYINPQIIDTLDLDKQVYCPELCIDMKYHGDDTGWGHALQIMPKGDSCYVGFDTNKLAYGLRWYCVSEDERAIGFCLPTTGTHHSSRYQYENGLFNTIGPRETDTFSFKFGYLNKTKTEKIKNNIENIIGRRTK